MDKKIESYLKRVELLFVSIEDFCKKQNLDFRYEEVDRYEEYGGSYKTKELYIYNNEEFLFKIKPIGAYIIASEGRVDIIGTYDEKAIIYLEKPYEMRYISKVGEQREELSKLLYEGFTKEGWYISLKRKKIVFVDDISLCETLEDISEYQCFE